MRDIDKRSAKATKEDKKELKRLQNGRGKEGFREYVAQYRKTYGYIGEHWSEDQDIYFACLEMYNDLDNLED